MTLEAMRPITPVAERPVETAADLTIRVVNGVNLQEATMRQVITPKVEVDHDARHVRLISQGLGLTEEKRTVGDRAVLIEVAARYRRGEGAIKQCYRYLVFLNPDERDGRGNLYAVRLPMGAWAPADPDICYEWLGRGGFQQGDFVLLPRKAIPSGSEEVPRPKARSRWEMAAESFRRILNETMGEDTPLDEWTRLIGRHDPKEARLFKKEARVFLVVERDTQVLHPEHAPMSLPAGNYEVVEDRSTSYWRKAID